MVKSHLDPNDTTREISIDNPKKNYKTGTLLIKSSTRNNDKTSKLNLISQVNSNKESKLQLYWK